jgi:hypothetical protein
VTTGLPLQGAVEWDGDPEAMIASETDPWVQLPDGSPVDWVHLKLPPEPGNGCEICGTSPKAGALEAMNSEFGVQRCDTCDRFDGDLAAAQALADLIGGTVWFYPSPKLSYRKYDD